MNGKLPRALPTWDTDVFAATLKHEIEALGAASLGLDRRLTGFGIIDEAITVIVLGRMTEVNPSKPGSSFFSR
tara:strand:+ start:315 stop:533 length:219 start_codon:yes stop_codon:yes gene_type:complete